MFNFLRRIFMPLDVPALLVEIEEIHSDHDIDQEVTDKVTAAVTAATANLKAELPADVQTAVTAATADLQTQLDTQGAALKAVVDKLTAPGVVATEATSAAVAIAQNALPVPNDAAGTSGSDATTGAAASTGASS